MYIFLRDYLSVVYSKYSLAELIESGRYVIIFPSNSIPLLRLDSTSF
jgi:hypothetical protein